MKIDEIKQVANNGKIIFLTISPGWSFLQIMILYFFKL